MHVLIGLLIILALMMISPLVLIAGVNFILEAGKYPEIPFTWGSVFGAFLIILIVRAEVTKK